MNLNRMLVKLMDLLHHMFGRCSHNRITWPTECLVHGKRGVFVTCLDCTRTLPYRNPELLNPNWWKESKVA